MGDRVSQLQELLHTLMQHYRNAVGAIHTQAGKAAAEATHKITADGNTAVAVALVDKQELKKTPGMGADELANALVKRAIRFRTQDNVAVVVVDLRQA